MRQEAVKVVRRRPIKISLLVMTKYGGTEVTGIEHSKPEPRMEAFGEAMRAKDNRIEDALGGMIEAQPPRRASGRTRRLSHPFLGNCICTTAEMFGFQQC